MKLYIAEKPDVAKAIRDALNISFERKDGYFIAIAEGIAITWCFGHMLQLLDPEDYDEKYAKWELQHLPICHIPWQKKPIPASQSQLKIIGELLSRDDLEVVIHAGDPDEEGQLLVDEILDYFGCSKPVLRLLINDNNAKVIKKSLSNMPNNSDFRGLSQSAEVRSVSDQLYGYNLSRAYTLVARKQGYQGILSVGRVQTPILGLVVRRDREHHSHIKSYYYDVKGNFDISGKKFEARYVPREEDEVDEKGRLINKSVAEGIIKECENQPAKILAAKITSKTESPPLPYNLLKLQTHCSQKFNLSPNEVKKITQNLRETYRLITYNRSDCQYLNDEHHADAPDTLNIIKQNIPEYADITNQADSSLKSRAFDSDKVSAHHAIIPTQATVNLSNLSNDEKNVYMLIAKAYIAQFYPKHEFDEVELTIETNTRIFKCSRDVSTNRGWLVLYDNNDNNEPLDVDLREITKNDTGSCISSTCTSCETKPRPLYTMATLLNDLTKVAKYVKDPKLKKVLIEKDKNKAEEHGGIGTPATRDEILKNLFDKGYLIQKGKTVTSTQIGQEFYDNLPDQAKYPDMTALWHEQQQFVVKGELDSISFVKGVMNYITTEINRVQENGIELSIKKIACPNCGRPLRRMKGKYGFFWGCTGFEQGCSFSCKDKGGIPVLTKRKPEVSSKYLCPDCGGGLVRRSGKVKGSFFWGCSNYPKCKKFYQDKNGQPNLVLEGIK